VIAVIVRDCKAGQAKNAAIPEEWSDHPLAGVETHRAA
jgi:hypothetical protein